MTIRKTRILCHTVVKVTHILRKTFVRVTRLYIDIRKRWRDNHSGILSSSDVSSRPRRSTVKPKPSYFLANVVVALVSFRKGKPHRLSCERPINRQRDSATCKLPRFLEVSKSKQFHSTKNSFFVISIVYYCIILVYIMYVCSITRQLQ